MSAGLSRRFFYVFLIAIASVMWFSGMAQNILAQSQKQAVVLSLKDVVSPSSADYLSREITTASNNGAEVIILEIDTPGGLVISMQEIVQAMLASDTPVVTYVSPQGARSASAGLYIMYAAHISAMSPATNTGAATPINMGSTPSDDEWERPELPKELEDGQETPIDSSEPEETPALEDIPATSDNLALRKKIIGDSVAYIRSLAELHGRNADWAERSVRDGVSITSNEALELGVIDMIAENRADLLEKIDGMTIRTAKGDVTLETSNLAINEVKPQLWEIILGFFANPQVAAILLTLGTTGLIAEIWNPGSIFPGAFGVLCLVLAFYGLNVISYNGLFLIILGIGALMIVMEAYTPSFGLLGLAGLLVFAAGLYFIFPDQFKVGYGLIGSVVGIGGAFLAFILIAIVGSRAGGPLIGEEAIKRRRGIVTDWDEVTGEGHVHVEGERWKARSKTPLSKGDEIIVEKVEGLILVVKKASDQGRIEKMLSDRHNRKTEDYVFDRS